MHVRVVSELTPPAVNPGLEARLWRSVSEQPDLSAWLHVCLNIVRDELPVMAMIVRRWDAAPPRLTTLGCAVAPSCPLTAEQLGGSRSDLRGPAEDVVRRFVQGRDDPQVGEVPSALADALLPTAPPGYLQAAPIGAPDGHVGVVLTVESADDGRPGSALTLLRPFVEVAFKNHERVHDLTLLREALSADRRALLSRLGRQNICEAIVGERRGLSAVMTAVEQVARTDAPVLILGETGSGKEVIARAIHERSERHRGPVVRVNCGAIPAELIDSELFGHERGSFTGAVATRKGWFERADGGTLFLDEVGELPAAAQVRLLRVLQDGSLQRVGGHDTVHVDVRIVAATHRDLSSMVSAGNFREDLWYRMSVFPIQLPPLRERLADLPELVDYFADRAGKRLGAPNLKATALDLERLQQYHWPGNVRELAAVIERAAILGGGRALDVSGALAAPTAGGGPSPSVRPDAPGAAHRASSTLDDVVRAHIRQVLAACHGRIEGPFGAAKVLDINPHTLRARMKKLGISWSQFRAENTAD